jgi:nucleotide-binding universal stress UspA family protein
MGETSHNNGPIRRVVVGVNGSPASAAALGWAIVEAAAHHADVDVVHAFHVPTRPIPGPTEPCGAWARIEDAATTMVDHLVYKAVDRVERLPRRIDQVVVNAPPARTLLQVARDADILAIGARGYGGFAGRLLGSVARHCVGHADCPVVVVPARPARAAGAQPGGEPARRRIVVGTDGSPNSRAALAWALRDARAHGAGVQVVHAWQPPYISGPYGGQALPSEPFEHAAVQVLDEALAAVGADNSSVPIARVTACGSAALTLIGLAQGADLLVVGSRGLGSFASLVLGSVSQQCAHDAPCPVMIVPLPGP